MKKYLLIDCSCGMNIHLHNGMQVFSHVDENQKRHTDDLLVEVCDLDFSFTASTMASTTGAITSFFSDDLLVLVFDLIFSFFSLDDFDVDVLV